MESEPVVTGAPSPEFGLLARVQAALPNLSPSMAKIAHLLLENPELPLSLSITELAERAGTSPPTVTRFCRQLGYGGYVPLRVGVAADLGRSDAQSEFVHELGRTFDPDESSSALLKTLRLSHINSIQAAADLIDLDNFEAAANAVAGSTHVDIYGVAGSATVAHSLHDRLYRIGVNTHYWSEVHHGLMSASLLGPGTAAIGISNSGRTAEVLGMLGAAKDAGATTIALSSDPQAPLTELADIYLRTSPPDQFFSAGGIAAQTVQMFACNVLYMLVAKATYSRTQESLARSASVIENHTRPRRRPQP
ncbi:MurR/RpiR family transcriptional regulator [Tessaracoccus terricola]